MHLIDTIKLFETKPEKIYQAGEVIFKTGESGNVMYGIIEGEVQMMVNDRVVEIIHQGEVFGEGALLHEDHLRGSTAIAKSNCRLALLDKEHFLFAVQETPMFALQVMRSYSDRFRRLKELLYL